MEFQKFTRRGKPYWASDSVGPRWASEMIAFYAGIAQTVSTQNLSPKPVNVCVLGGTYTEGKGVSTTNQNESGIWQHILRRQLQRMFGGKDIGYVPCGNNRTGAPPSATRAWTLSGTSGADQLNTGIGMKSTRLTSTNFAQISNIECDRVQLFGNVGTGTGKVTIDGVVSTFDATGGSGAPTYSNMLFDSGVLTPGLHTVKVQGNNGTTDTVILEGGMFYYSNTNTGIRWWDMANGTASTDKWVENTTIGNSWASCFARTQIAPHLVVISFGIDDIGNSISASTYKTNLSTIINRIRSNVTGNVPSILFVVPWARADGSYTAANWEPYRNAMIDVAAATPDSALVDLTTVIGYPNPDIYSLISTDGLNPNDTGHQMIGQAVQETFGSWAPDSASADAFHAGSQNNASHGSELAYTETLYNAQTVTAGNTDRVVISSGGPALSCTWQANARPVIIRFGLTLSHATAGGLVDIYIEDVSSGSGGPFYVGQFRFDKWQNAGDTKYVTGQRRVLIGDSSNGTSIIGTKTLNLRVSNVSGAGAVTINGGLGGTTVSTNSSLAGHTPNWLQVLDT